MTRQTPLRKALTVLRRRTGETRVDMAKKVGVSYTLAFAVESGRQSLAMNYARKLVSYFGPDPVLKDAIVEQVIQVKFPLHDASIEQRKFLYDLSTLNTSDGIPDGAWRALHETLELHL